MNSGLFRFVFFFVVFTARSGCSFSNKKNDPWLTAKIADVFQKISASPGAVPTKSDAEALLKSLGIQASMEPRLAYARPERIPLLFLSSVGAILRLASGVFPPQYKVGLTERNASKYSYISFRDTAQLFETGYSNVPPLPLELYECEADADSKLVREACSILSLIVTIYPTPMGGPRYRAKVLPKLLETSAPSDVTLPYLSDPNAQVQLSGSRRIIDYLFTKYGPPGGNTVPDSLQQPMFSDGWNWPRMMAYAGLSLARSNAGGHYKDSRFHEQFRSPRPLVLYAYEGSPFCKLVRETLSAYEIPHTIYFTPRGGEHRQKLFTLTGRCQVPFLQDPNTGVDLFESEAIVEYLEKQYGLASSKVQYL
jgi:Glutathione S-transferase, N-terminal domain